MRTPAQHALIRNGPIALLLLTILLAGGGAHARGAATVELPVTRLVLFTSGVGYFEHSGTVTGDAELELSVPEEAMNDLLQSLVLQDFGGGTVRPVRYPSRDPLERILASYALDLSADPSLAQLLSQARGQRVLIETSDSLSGRIVNVERVEVPEEEPLSYLTLATLTGLRRIDLAEVRTITFADRELQSELEAALAAIARQSEEDEQTLTLRFEGEGERPVSVGYVREMPVWKTSYRLLLDGDGEADLQGWAIFDNPTATDFKDVAISFVAGQPISFVSSLFEPIYIERQHISPDRSPGVTARQFEADSFARAADEAKSRANLQLAAPAPTPRPYGAGVESMAQGSRSGASFEYRVTEPVSVGRFESAMVPIISTAVEAQQLSIYDQASHPLHPLRGLRLVNDTGLHLASGPVSVFDDGGFAGNALLGDVVPGDSRILAYAVDLDLSVNTVSESEPERLVAIRIANGLVETGFRQRISISYEIDVRAGGQRFLVIEQPRRDGYEVVSPTIPPATTPQAYRFGVAIGRSEADPPADPTVPTHLSCEVQGACELRVVLERELSRSVAISNLSSEQILFYLENSTLSDGDRDSLSAILDLKQQLADLDRRIDSMQQQVEEIFRDQGRIRQNMAQLDRDSSLYRRYLAELEAQENELDDLGGTVEELLDERRRVQGQLDELILSL
ncbi:MAG TPA: hypothetical protein VF168_07990 [Trueperaceae bacterium]